MQVDVECLPKSNAQAPDGLHFQTGALVDADPGRVVDRAAIFIQASRECVGQVVR